jgi:hypothetical protein
MDAAARSSCSRDEDATRACHPSIKKRGKERGSVMAYKNNINLWGMVLVSVITAIAVYCTTEYLAGERIDKLHIQYKVRMEDMRNEIESEQLIKGYSVIMGLEEHGVLVPIVKGEPAPFDGMAVEQKVFDEINHNVLGEIMENMEKRGQI